MADEPPQRPSDDPADALDHIVDDLKPREQAFSWAGEQILAGRLPEDVTAELVAQGWDESEAEELVELAGKQTRSERGIRTRDDVVAESNRQYSRSMSGLLIGFPTWAALRRLFYSIRWLWQSRPPGPPGK